FTWRVVAGHLPAGLKMAKFFGVESTEITGTPTKVETSTFTIQVQDGAGDTAQQAFSLTINPPLPLVVNTPSGCCSPGTVGTPYSVQFFAVGGVQPYTWALVAGQFPPGLSLAKNGLLSGTPTTAGTFTFTVQVTDKATGRSYVPNALRWSQSRSHRSVSPSGSYAPALRPSCVNVRISSSHLHL